MYNKSIYVKVSPSDSFGVIGIGPNPLITAEAISTQSVEISSSEFHHHGSIQVKIDGHQVAEIFSIEGSEDRPYDQRHESKAIRTASKDAVKVVFELLFLLREVRNSEREEDVVIDWDESAGKWGFLPVK
jgi:hypothetical protein